MILLLIIFFGIILSLINLIPFFISIAHTPAGTVYTGIIHYWEDYFFYLNHFFQGAHGQWLTLNQYTTEATKPSLIYWSNILMGKIGGLIDLSPLNSYVLSVFLLVICIPVLAYHVSRLTFHDSPWKQLAVVFLTMTATSFPAYDFFRNSGLMGNRMGGVPHQILQTVLTYLIILLFFSTAPRRVSVIFLISASFLLSSLNPVAALILIASLLLSTFKGHTFKGQTLKGGVKLYQIFVVILLAIALIIPYFYLFTLYKTPPHNQAGTWEALQQVHLPIKYFLMTLGPIGFLAIIGVLFSIWKRNTILRPVPDGTGLRFSIIFLLISYGLFFSPIPQKLGITNTRVIFPALHLALAILAVTAIDEIAEFIARRRRFHKQIYVAIVTLFLCGFSLLSLPMWKIEMDRRFYRLNEINENNLLLYLPLPFYHALNYLATQLPYTDTVLANPQYHLDTIAPAFSGHTTYSGHIVTTVNNGEKQTQAIAFFQKQMTKEQAVQLFKKNNIRYVIVTAFDSKVADYLTAYPFLKIDKEIEGVTILYANQK